MVDFITQSWLDGDREMPEDALEHDALARSILAKLDHLPCGSVVALQASWGGGKTDLLARIAGLALEGTSSEVEGTAAALWINPWQYGTPDLLTPLVFALLEQIPPKRRSGKKALLKAAESVLAAGANFGLKALSLAVPGGEVLKAAAEPAKDLLEGLFGAVGEQDEPDIPDLDPVAAMGKRFRELVEAVLADRQVRRVLVCVDDLDRCLPDRQVTLLEAIRFLISSGATASFLVAIDPTLARQAVETHYKTDRFDTQRYLDKMFDLRLNLPGLTDGKITALVANRLAAVAKRDGEVAEGLTRLGNADPAEYAGVAPHAFCVPALQNPRIIGRVLDRLTLLALAYDNEQPLLSKDGDLDRMLVWLGIAERWPAVRAALQTAGEDLPEYYVALHNRYVDDTTTEIAVIDSLPCPQDDLGLKLLIRSVRHQGDPKHVEYLEHTARRFQAFDAALREAGL